MTAAELHDLLRLRFAMPEWAVFRQVCEAGTGGARYADAIAMNLFPSRGMEVHGFEVKVSRGDWLRELKHPEKADPLARFCDRWWIVAAERPLVVEGELPPTWGLLVPRAGTLYAVVPAEKRAAEPLSRGFIATLLRRVIEDDALVPPRPQPRGASDIPERGDPEKVRARLKRLRDTATRISNEVTTAIWDLDRAERKAADATGMEG